jgi:menaquinone-dependent protoporphyrinogen IX oxidase
MRLFIVMMVSLLFSVNCAQAKCANMSEENAFNLRALKSTLMVAALSCGQQSDYNRFVKKYQTTLSSGGKAIKKYFHRIYGKNAESHLNKFITNLANQASKGSINGDDITYCDQTKDVFKKLLRLGTEGVSKFAQKEYTSLHGIRACRG